MTQKGQIPEIKGVADEKAAQILQDIKMVVEFATGRTPNKKPIALLPDGATLIGLLNKTNEVIAQLQGEPPPPPRATITGTSVFVTTSTGGGGTPISITQSLVNDLTETLTGTITSTGTLVRTAVDAGAHKMRFWDEDINSISYLNIGTGLSVSGTGTQAKFLNTIAAAGIKTVTTSINTTASAALSIATGIPAGTPRIDIIYDGVSFSTTCQPSLQFTDTGGTAVMAGQQTYNSGNDATQDNVTNTVTSNVILFAISGTAVETISGRVECYLVDDATNLWSIWWELGSIGGQRVNFGAAVFTITAPLGQIKSSTTAGSALHDAGKIWTTRYEYTGTSTVIEPLFVAILSDETSAFSTGTAKKKMRNPRACVVTEVRGSLNSTSTAGATIINIKVEGTTILGTNKLQIDQGAKTSRTSTASATLVTTTFADDLEWQFDADQVGTTVTGAKAYVIGRWA